MPGVDYKWQCRQGLEGQNVADSLAHHPSVQESDVIQNVDLLSFPPFHASVKTVQDWTNCRSEKEVTTNSPPGSFVKDAQQLTDHLCFLLFPFLHSCRSCITKNRVDKRGKEET